jgi:hypothetical protein
MVGGNMIATELGHCWIQFENGYIISIFNGYGSYSENHFNRKEWDKLRNPKAFDRCESKTCEIAIIRNDIFCTSQFIESEGSTIGYIKPDELPDIMKKVKEAKE